MSSSYSRAGPIQVAELALVAQSASGNLAPSAATTITLGRAAFFPRFSTEAAQAFWRAVAGTLAGDPDGRIAVENQASSNSRTYNLDWEAIE